jgi:hypothetical protein
MRKTPFLGKPGKALLLLALFCSVLACANFSSLHQAFHPNATNPDHQCVVKLLASGQVDAPVADPAIIIAALTLDFPAAEQPLPVRSFFSLPPGRAPPADLS